MNRWLALLVTVAGAAIAAYLAMLAVTGALVGFLWIFVFGDDPWPPGWEVVVGILLGAVGIAGFVMAFRRIWFWLRPAC